MSLLGFLDLLEQGKQIGELLPVPIARLLCLKVLLQSLVVAGLGFGIVPGAAFEEVPVALHQNMVAPAVLGGSLNLPGSLK